MTLRPRAGAALAALAVLSGVSTAACTGDDGSTEAFCAEVRSLPALESVVSGFSDADPATLRDDVAKARSAYRDLEEAAPSEIRSQTGEVVDLVDDVLDAVEAHPDDPTAAADDLRAVMDDHPDVEAARAEVATYAEANCDVELDPTLGGSSTTTSAATTDPAGTDGVAGSTTTPGG